MKKLVLLLIFLFSLVNFASAGLEGQCSIIHKDTACTGAVAANLYFATTTNAHVCYTEAAQPCYNYKLCCPGSGLTFDDTPIKEIVGIYGLNPNPPWLNTHIEAASQNIYSKKLTFFGSDSCSVKSSCSAGEYCLFSMSSLTNAHAGQCSNYANKICCLSSVPAGTYVSVKSITSSSCNSEIDEGEIISVTTKVSEFVSGVESDSVGAGVALFSKLGTEDGVVISTGTTGSTGEYTDSDISFSQEGTYTLYAISAKDGFNADTDEIPTCTITVNAVIPGGGEPGEPGTYIVYSECYCPTGEDCSDGVGKKDMSLYDLATHSLIRHEPASLECLMVQEEEVPFFGFFSLLLFLLIIGIFYNSEMFKKKNILNKNIKR